MKESGINYFYSSLGLDTDSFAILYTFEEGAGSIVNSITGANPLFSGEINGNIWGKPGSGTFTGGYVSITNGSGLDSSLSFSHLISYEQITTGKKILFNNKLGASGYEFGLTDTNKIYFETAGEPVIATTSNNLSSKNLISVSYIANFLSVGQYNFTSKSFEFETFQQNFGLLPSDKPTLGSGFTGYIDYYLYSNDYLGAEVLNQLASGWYVAKTGSQVSVETICAPGVTGYQSQFYSTTGVTGYSVGPIGNLDGVGDFTGVFPTGYNLTPMTGILSSGLTQIPVTGSVCVSYSGELVDLFSFNSGYISGFGMDKTLILRSLSGDMIKYSTSNELFADIFNHSFAQFNSGLVSPLIFDSGALNLFFNGLGVDNSGIGYSDEYVFVTGSSAQDLFFFDLKSGDRKMSFSGSLDTTYTGQEIFFNGINLVSGYDFRAIGNRIFLTGNNTGISGILFENPIVLPYITGGRALYSGEKFNRNSSNVYQNGIRLFNRSDYIEGSKFDMLTGNNFNEYNNTIIYNNNELYWE